MRRTHTGIRATASSAHGHGQTRLGSRHSTSAARHAWARASAPPIRPRSATESTSARRPGTYSSNATAPPGTETSSDPSGNGTGGPLRNPRSAARRATRKPERKPVPSAASASLATYCRPSTAPATRSSSSHPGAAPPTEARAPTGPEPAANPERPQLPTLPEARRQRNVRAAELLWAQARQPSGPAREERDLHPTGSRPGHQWMLDGGCDLGGATHRSRDSRPAAWADVRQLLYCGQMAMASPWCSGSIGSVGSTRRTGLPQSVSPPRRVADQT